VTTNESVADLPGHPTKEPLPLRLLVLEDSQEDFELSLAILENAGIRVSASHATSARAFAFLLETAEHDVIISDYNLDGWTGFDAFEMLQHSGKNTPFILMSGALGEEKAVDCIKRGMADFILKSRMNALPGAILRAVEDQRIRAESAAADAALRESEKRFRILADAISSAVFVYQGTSCLYANRAAQTLTGYSDDELMNMSSWDLLHPESRSLLVDHGFSHLTDKPGNSRYEIKAVRKGGEIRTWDATVGITEIDGQPAGIITAVDITDRSLKESVRQGTVRDPLTGLFNVTQMQTLVRAEVKRSERSGRSFAFMVLRLREITGVAEPLLSLTESRALCKLANIVGSVCRSNDTAFRHGPREFAVLLPETSLNGARQLTARLAERVVGEGADSALPVEVGIAIFPQDA
jgi:PAS domain S-box-containing protein/diguanylate cyclase (GGDEF)-like protein